MGDRVTPQPTLIIACGALAREIQALLKRNRWEHIQLRCLPAALHNRPQLIADRLRESIERAKPEYERILIGYADCGTGGAIDAVLAEFDNVERLSGPHCYATYGGQDTFQKLSDQEPGTFYLTDFLARYFDKFVVKPLKLDEHPQLRDAYFGNYRRLVYLSQINDEKLLARARAAGEFLGLEFEHHHTGYGELKTKLIQFATAH